jgi:hypothetical protein
MNANSAFLPPAAEVARVRMYLWLEAGLFLSIPIAAAAVARGYGIYFGQAECRTRRKSARLATVQMSPSFG